MIIRKEEECKQFNVENRGLFVGKSSYRNLLRVSETEGSIYFFNKHILEPGAGFAPHKHEIGGEIFYVLKGELCAGSPGKEQVLKPGDFILANTGDVHYCENRRSEPCEFLSISVGGYGEWYAI